MGSRDAPKAHFIEATGPMLSSGKSTDLSANIDPTGLTGRQLVLLNALIGLDSRLGQMYHGAVWVLLQTVNPDRLAHAAHGLRELMEKLPLFLDVPIKAKEKSLTQGVNELADSWEKAVKLSKCHHDGTWTGEIDGGLKTLLGKAESFFAWYREAKPKRKERTASVLKNLDPSGKKLPKPLEILRVEEWETINGYFQGVSHHNKNVDITQFDIYLDALETFILDRLRPRIFDDHDALSELIREAEQ